MAAPTVSQDELQRVHRALCITVPLDQASPLVLTTLAVIAHCWRKGVKTPQPTRPTPAEKQSLRAPMRRVPGTNEPVDLKRRAAGDTD